VAWERLEGASPDVAAWVRFAAEQGVYRVALAGHSLGALKAILYQAEHPDPGVVGLALISPPLRPEWDTGRYPDLLAQAEQLVADGKAEELLPGPWIRLSAQTLLSTHRFNLDQFGRTRPDAPIARVRCPVLAILGTKEPSIGFPDDLESVRRNARAAPRVELRVIEGADHSYTGQEAELAEVLADWVAGVSSDRSPPS
jgi:pimeloyl-ACP methyl ester carboxylesterase